MGAGDDFAPSGLDSLENVIGLKPNDPLNGFAEMWYQIFLWALFSSMFVHVIAAVIAFGRLRKHRLGRWMSVLIIITGILSPLTGGVITSAAIAGVYRASGFELKPLYALVWGVGQTIVIIFFSFTRLLATL